MKLLPCTHYPTKEQGAEREKQLWLSWPHPKSEVSYACVQRCTRKFHIVCVTYSHNISFWPSTSLAQPGSSLPNTDSSISLHPVALSQKHPLEAVCRHAALVLRLRVALWVGAAGWGALRGAQVVHERQSIFPTEVHKFNVADAWVKVDACWKENRISGDRH